MFETTHYIQGSVKGLRATFLSITMETRGGMTIESTGGGGYLPIKNPISSKQSFINERKIKTFP